MQRVRKDLLSDEEIQNWNCSCFSTIMPQNFSQTFAIYSSNNNVFVLKMIVKSDGKIASYKI